MRKQINTQKRPRLTGIALALSSLPLAGFIPVSVAARLPQAQSTGCINKAYVSNSRSDNVSVIDTRTNKIIATIPTGKGTVNPTFTPDARHLYVSNTLGGTISIIDVNTDTVTSTLQTGAPMPEGLAFTPDGKKLVVTFLADAFNDIGWMRVISLATGKMTPLLEVQSRPERTALTRDGKRAYVANLVSNTVSVVDVAHPRILTTIPLGTYSYNIVMSPREDVAYVNNVKSNTISVIDTRSNTVVRTIDTETGPNGMALSRDGKMLYVTNLYASKVQAIDLATGKAVMTKAVDGMPGYMSMTPDGKRAYFVRPYGNTVSVIDTATLEVTDTIQVGVGPSVVTICRLTAD